MKQMIPRCDWCGSDPIYLAYHDLEWGVPLHDDRRLFEMLTLEGAQAGLSWLTILRKRDGYRQAFDDFDPKRIACYADADIERLPGDARIVRNRLKIASVLRNAQGVLSILEDTGSLDAFLWQFVDHLPQQNA
jgi:DNA-3-methyladenine glycosylase I